MLSYLLALSIQIAVIRHGGPYSLNKHELRNVLYDVTRKFDRAFHIQIHFESRNFRRETSYLEVYPPITQPDGYRYITGLSPVSCPLHHKVLVKVWLQAKNQFGENRLIHDEYVILHELGHAFGAHHVSSASIMNPDAIRLFDKLGPLKFDERSKREIGRCLNL